MFIYYICANIFICIFELLRYLNQVDNFKFKSYDRLYMFGLTCHKVLVTVVGIITQIFESSR